MNSITLTLAAVLTVLHCSADQLPQPTNLTFNFSVNEIGVNLTWSWQRPSRLPANCTIQYEISSPKGTRRTRLNSYIERCAINVHNYTVKTLAVESCNGWTHSKPVPIKVNQMSQDKVVKDLRCFLDSSGSGMNCSWIPKDQSLNLTFSHCHCNHNRKDEPCKPVKDCDRYTSGMRNGCFMKEVSHEEYESVFLVESTNGLDVIKPVLVLPSPKLNITVVKDLLELSWIPPNHRSCSWEHELCFTQCGREERCWNFTTTSYKMDYDANCMYTFRSRVFSSYCSQRSDYSEDIKYGTTKPPDATLTVVTIVIPIILFICVTLSCYCFWKHSDIFCSNPPDPSSLLKDLMSGNKEHENERAHLYTPLPEAVEICTISPITENRRPQENP